MGDVFEYDWEGSLCGPAKQRLKTGSDQRQSASGVGVAEQAGIFAPEGVALPMPAFTAPMGAYLLSHAPGGSLRVQAGDKVARQVGFGLPGGHGLAFWRSPLGKAGFFRRGSVARAEKLPGLGEDGRLRIGIDAAELALDEAAMPGIGTRKRGAC